LLLEKSPTKKEKIFVRASNFNQSRRNQDKRRTKPNCKYPGRMQIQNPKSLKKIKINNLL